MKKTILFVIILLNMITISKGQNLKETVDFINDAILESTKSVYHLIEYDQIKVNEKGKIIEDTYMTVPNLSIMESRASYLKNLKYSETIFFSEPDGTHHYVIVLKCIDDSNCIQRQIRTQDEVKPVDKIAITVYNREQSEKIKIAIIHLLLIAKTNNNFLTKDIF